MSFVSSLNKAAAALDSIRGCFLADFEFPNGHVRANDSGCDMEFGGNTYFGLGTFGTFDGVTEDVNGVSYGVRFELSGIDPGLIATIKNERYQGGPVTLYCGMCTENNELVDTPEVIWKGYMDTMDLEMRGRVWKLILQCEHRVRQAPPISRFCDAEQKTLNPGDRFFEQLPFVHSYTSKWGSHSTGWNYKPGGGYTPG